MSMKMAASIMWRSAAGPLIIINVVAENNKLKLVMSESSYLKCRK